MPHSIISCIKRRPTLALPSADRLPEERDPKPTTRTLRRPAAVPSSAPPRRLYSNGSANKCDHDQNHLLADDGLAPTRPAGRAQFQSRAAGGGGKATGASSLSYVTGRFVKGALSLPRKTYEKETFDFRASLPMTSPKALLRRRDSNRARVPQGLL